MILVCANRFASGVEPLVVNRAGVCIVYAFDGSGSWGAGAEAAAWFRNWIAKESDGASTSPETIMELLAAGIRALPSEITGCDFHWEFSLAVAICRTDTVQVGASGSIAALAIRSKGFDRLFVPKRLVDELVTHGTILPAEGKNHQYRRIFCGPFIGADNNPELHWCAPISLFDGDRLVLADAALPHLLEKYDFTFGNAVELRDAIEKYGVSTTPTVILDNHANAG